MKKEVQEVLGVPDNIINSAKRFYSELYKSTMENIEHSDDDETYTFKIDFDTPLKVGEYNINSINTEVRIVPVEDRDYVDYVSMGVGTQTKQDSKKPYRGKLMTDITNPDFSLMLAVPESWELSDISDWFVREKKEITSSLSHELKHLFDDQKKEYEQYRDRSRYMAGRDMPNFRIPSLNQLGHYIYFMSMIESLVRPTEILTYMDEEKISKKDFINFLKNNKTYTKLKDINDFSLDKIKQDVVDNMDRVEEIFRQLDIDYSNMTQDEKVNQILDLWYYNYVHSNIDVYQKLMASNFMEQMFGFPENKSKVVDRHISRVTKFNDNPIDFYKFEEKYLKKVSEEIIKKIHKLYSLLPEDHFDKQTNLPQKISSRK